MRHKTADVSSLELTENIIRTRAYKFYEQRGYEDGRDLEDWLRAWGEIIGKKPTVAEKETEGGTRAAVYQGGCSVKASVVHFRRFWQGVLAS